MSLPTINGSQPNKIHEFYEKLLFNVQSLETMGKLQEVNGYVRMTINKLPGIRGLLVRMDDSWREWNFPQLVDELRKWTERNPIQTKAMRSRYVTSLTRHNRNTSEVVSMFIVKNLITGQLIALRQ